MNKTAEDVSVAGIFIPKRIRELREDVLVSLTESIGSLGLRNPITIRSGSDDEGDESDVLVTGRNRLEVFIRQGWKTIPALRFEGTEREAEMWEISENFHRAELTVIERSDHATRWKRLFEEGSIETAVPTRDTGLPTTPVKEPAKDVLGRSKASSNTPTDEGVRALAAALGQSKTQAARLLKIGELSSEEKVAAVDAGLSDNNTLLYKIAKEAPEKRLEVISEEKAKRDAPRIRKAKAVDVAKVIDAKEQQYDVLDKAWLAAGGDARRDFVFAHWDEFVATNEEG